MKKMILMTGLMLMSMSSWAYVERSHDLKFDSQFNVESQVFTTPLAANGSTILNDQATSASATTEVTSFSAQPDVCRVLLLTPGGVTADVPAGDVVVAGLDADGDSLSETLTLPANHASPVATQSAFCSLSSVTFPIQDGAGATYDLGVTDELGLKRCMDGDHVVMAAFGSTFEAVRPAVSPNASVISKNKVDLNSALDGASDVRVFFIQNFRCL